MSHAAATYEPLDTPKPFATELWIVDGPSIRFGPPLLKMPFPTRATIVRLADGGLFVHSPTRLTPGLKAEIDALGPVRFIVGPNRIHYWWIPDWRNAYPQAEVWLAPRIREQAGDRIDFPAHDMADAASFPWGDEIATLAVAGGYMTEMVFLHRQSATLILTDLIENFEPKRLGPVIRLMTWLGGARDPDGQMPRDMRSTFRDRAALRDAIEAMIAWQPRHIVVAHGRCYGDNAVGELRRAFRWVLP